MSGRLFRAVDSLAREHTEKAIETLADVMNNPLEETRDRLSAAKDLLDRGHGKPLQATIALPANRRQAAALAALSDEELMERVNGAALPQLIEQNEVDVLNDPLLD